MVVIRPPSPGHGTRPPRARARPSGHGIRARRARARRSGHGTRAQRARARRDVSVSDDGCLSRMRTSRKLKRPNAHSTVPSSRVAGPSVDLPNTRRGEARAAPRAWPTTGVLVTNSRSSRPPARDRLDGTKPGAAFGRTVESQQGARGHFLLVHVRPAETHMPRRPLWSTLRG